MIQPERTVFNILGFISNLKFPNFYILSQDGYLN